MNTHEKLKTALACPQPLRMTLVRIAQSGAEKKLKERINEQQ